MLATTLETLIHAYNARNGSPLSPARVSCLAEELADAFTAAASSIDWQALASTNEPKAGRGADTTLRPADQDGSAAVPAVQDPPTETPKPKRKLAKP